MGSVAADSRVHPESLPRPLSLTHPEYKLLLLAGSQFGYRLARVDAKRYGFLTKRNTFSALLEAKQQNR